MGSIPPVGIGAYYTSSISTSSTQTSAIGEVGKILPGQAGKDDSGLINKVERRSSNDYTVTISDEAKRLMLKRGGDEADVATFEDVLEKVAEQDGLANPKEFLKSLSSDEMESVRLAHGLALDINEADLDFEGAYNLLRPWNDYVDLNNNGQYRVGAGRVRAFPPANAPSGVFGAFNQAVAGINGPPGLKAIISRAPFFAAEISANLKYDPQGNPVGFYTNDEPGYKNIYAQPNFSYQDLLGKIMGDLDKSKPSGMSDEHYRITKKFLETFKAGLVANDVA